MVHGQRGRGQLNRRRQERPPARSDFQGGGVPATQHHEGHFTHHDAVSALALLVLLFVPIWRIDLMAPNTRRVSTSRSTRTASRVTRRKIDGLNHYIGMAHIKNEMFPEFKFLPKLIVVLSVLGLVAAAWGKRILLFLGLVTLSLFGAWALYDMYKWGYDYGHNLDPKAAIKVEGMAYQPH